MEKGNEIKTVVPALRFPEFINMGNWKIEILSNISSNIFDGIHQTPKYVNEGIPFYSVENIVSNKNNKYISEKDYLLYSSTNKVEKGDILISRIGTIGKSVVVNWDCRFYIYVTLAAVKKTNKFDSYFLSSFFQSEFYQKEILSRSLLNAVPCKINMEELRKTRILLPEIREQQKIANCLSSLDDLIEATAQKVEALKGHKKGLMQRLFPAEGKNVPDLRFPEFQRTQVWEDAILGTVADYENGKAHENEIDEDGDFIVVNSKLISTDGEVIKRTNTPYCLADKEDILMVLSDVPNGRAIAKCFFVDESGKYTVNQRICRLRSKSINSKFLFYLINRNPYFLSFDDGVKQTNLKKSEVLECPLMIPSSPIEQQKIADLLSSIDDLIIATEQRIKSLEKHKKGLMQQLFPKI